MKVKKLIWREETKFCANSHEYFSGYCECTLTTTTELHWSSWHICLSRGCTYLYSHATLFSSSCKIFSAEKCYLTTWIMRVPNITYFRLLTTEKQPFRHHSHAHPCMSVCVNLCMYICAFFYVILCYRKGRMTNVNRYKLSCI